MAQTLEFRPKRVLLYFRLVGAVIVPLILGSVIGGVACAKDQSGMAALIAGIAFFLAAINAVHTYFYFSSIRYQLDDTHLTSSKGVLWKMKRATPIEKITNTDVRQGPIARLLGVGDVWVFTPSTGALLPEEMLSGVENPHEIRKAILERAEAVRGTALPAGSGATAPDQVTGLLKEISATLKSIEAKLK